MSAGLACPYRGCPTFHGSPRGGTLTSRPIQIPWGGKNSTAVTIGQSREDILISLWETFQECSSPDWDGYGASPVKGETFTAAEAFLRALPVSLPMPDVGAEPGGEIGFEWRSNGNVLAVTIDKDFRLVYASVFGRDTIRGSTDFEGSLSPFLLELVAKITQ